MWANLISFIGPFISKLSALINIPDLISKLKMKENYFYCASIYLYLVNIQKELRQLSLN